MLSRVLILFVYFLVSEAQSDSEGERCLKGDNTYGVCRSLSSCPTAIDEVKRRIKQNICLFDDTDPLVCCSGDQTATNPLATIPKRPPIEPGKCILPPYPKHGIYVVANAPYVIPGQGLHDLQLNVTCRSEYEIKGDSVVSCQDGMWSHSIPKCVPLCKLDSHPSVRYKCLVTVPFEGSRDCKSYEPSGTIVRPECNSPFYYSAVPLPYMRCVDGNWDYVAVCNPECGRPASEGMYNSEHAPRGQATWHATIYQKTGVRPYEHTQICGGSLISETVVISAAQCFWKDGKQQPSSMFTVALGKHYRTWGDYEDHYTERQLDVKEIKIPESFQGSATNFQDDIAIVILDTPITYHTFIKPICLNFDDHFDKTQLQPGKLGNVAGWGHLFVSNQALQVLRVFEVPYVDIVQCFTKSPPDYRNYITNDKFCAGYRNDTTLCRRDTGGGIAFPESEEGRNRYYLRGIVSAVASGESSCDTNTLTVFTHLFKHEHFIKKYVDNTWEWAEQ